MLLRASTIKIWLPALIVLGTITLLLALLVSAVAIQTTPLASPTALADIPPDYYTLYVQAGDEYETDWAVLAAIGKVETNHGRSTLPGVRSGVNSYGCCAGPMQFAVSRAAGCRVCVGDTWGAYGVDGNGDGERDVYDPADAIPAAARYTNANGAPDDWKRALWRYNQSDAYFHEVMQWADRYRSLPPLMPTGPADPALAAARNISTAGLRAEALIELHNANSWGLHLISGYRQDTLPEHPSGLAIDVSNGVLTPEMAAYAESLRQRGAQGAPIRGVIYNNRSTGYGGDWNWRPYRAGYTGNPTQDHLDHVHVWVK